MQSVIFFEREREKERENKSKFVIVLNLFRIYSVIPWGLSILSPNTSPLIIVELITVSSGEMNDATFVFSKSTLASTPMQLRSEARVAIVSRLGHGLRC